MNSERFFNIMKLLDKYAYSNTAGGEPYFFESKLRKTPPSSRYVIDLEKLQTNFTDEQWGDYSYFFYEKDSEEKKPSGKIHAFLQGAIHDTKSGLHAPDQSFIKYQKQVLKLLFGMYVFIDPTKSETKSPGDQVPYYLLGPMKGKVLKPIFNYRLFSNIPTKSAAEDLKDPPEKWLRFILAFNEFTRDSTSFVEQDFVRLFNYKAYIKKRSLGIEQENNLLYVPSGEMDHCILQWLVLYLKSAQRVSFSENLLASEFSIDLRQMYPTIESFYRQNNDRNYIVPNYHRQKGTNKINYVTPLKKLSQWLETWGLFNEQAYPTERLMAAFRWFYFYLASELRDSADIDNNLKWNLTLVDPKSVTDNFYFRDVAKEQKREYIKLFGEILSAQQEHGGVNFKGSRQKYKSLLTAYFELLFAWQEDVPDQDKPWEVFAERCRFRPFVHFLFRNFATAVSHKFMETSCRGYIVFPILTTHRLGDAAIFAAPDKKDADHIDYVGYFLGHIKDSDVNGNTLFDSLLSAADPFEGYPHKEDYLIELKQVVSYLGRIEVEKTYYKGIVNMHQENARKQSIHSAVAACMSRNLSHTTGSHKSPWFKNFFGAHLNELKVIYKGEQPRLVGETLKAISNLNFGADISELPKDLTKPISDLNTQLLSYFDFVNDNMEFIADITISYDAEKSTVNFRISEIYHEYAGLTLMHYGLFDDREMKRRIRLLSIEDDENLFQSASVAIPNGQLGKSAFFTIIENIMRNFYKHTRAENEETCFSLKISSVGPLDSDFWCIDFFDSVSSAENIKSRDQALLDRINNDFIKRSIIQSNGELRAEGWGFSEMKACCAYLVNFPISSLDLLPNSDGLLETADHKLFNPLLEAGYYTDEGDFVEDLAADIENRNLGYRFYLRRAKKLGIDPQANYISLLMADNLPDTENYGIKVLSRAEMSGTNPYELLLLKQDDPVIDRNQRFFLADSFSFSDYSTPVKIEEYAWRQYIKRRYPNEIDEIQIISTVKDLANVPEAAYSNVFLIDDHGEIAEQEGFNAADLKAFLWYLPYDKRTKRDGDFFIISRRNELIRMKLIEVARTRISIFDERIQQEANADYENIPSLKLRDIHALGKVYIPGPEHDLTDNEVVSRLQELIGRQFESKNNYVILHFTLFEKLAVHHGYNNNVVSSNNLEDYYKKLVKLYKLDTGKRFLIFCSGRGRPSNLFKGCYYLHLSTLQYFTIRTISKYSLVNLLKSLRKI